MSSVLYYSKYCENCKKLLYEVGKTKTQRDMHFLRPIRSITPRNPLNGPTCIKTAFLTSNSEP